MNFEQLSKQKPYEALIINGLYEKYKPDVRAVIDWDAELHRLYQSHGIEIKYLKFEFSKVT